MADEDLLPIDERDDWRKSLAALAPRPQMDSRMMQAAPVAANPPALVNPTGTPQMPPETALKIPGNEGLKNSTPAPSLTGGLKVPTTPVDAAPSLAGGLKGSAAPSSTQWSGSIQPTPQDLEPHGWRKALGLGLSALAGKDAGATADEFLHGAERRYAAQQKEKGAADYQQAETEHLRAETANLGGGGEVPFTPFGET